MPKKWCKMKKTNATSSQKYIFYQMWWFSVKGLNANKYCKTPVISRSRGLQIDQESGKNPYKCHAKTESNNIRKNTINIFKQRVPTTITNLEKHPKIYATNHWFLVRFYGIPGPVLPARREPSGFNPGQNQINKPTKGKESPKTNPQRKHARGSGKPQSRATLWGSENALREGLRN